MSGGVVWITGLSGAGKTTTARALAECFVSAGREPVIIDGDQVREAVGDVSCGHNLEDRLTNAYRICRFAKLVAAQGRIVIVATMSLFHEIHSWNRDNFPCYLEVFLDVSLDTLASNDSKGLYANGKDLPGMDLTPQFPLSPHVLIENQGFSSAPAKIAEDIHRLFLEVHGIG